MAGFPDIRLYKSNYTADEAKNISKEKGSIVFSTVTKRLYVAKEQFGSNIQDILWKPDADNQKYDIEVKQVDSRFNVTLRFDDKNQEISIITQGKTTKVASYKADVDNLKIKADVKAKNTVTEQDEVIINKGDSIQNAVQILARQFEKNFVWKEWQDEN